MGEVKIWYIDRSRNYYYKELDAGLESIVHASKKNSDILITPDMLIDELVRCGAISAEAKNKFAHLTRFRDHGFINMYNQPGDSVVDYVENRLDLDSMIIDHFIKRPVYKDQNSKVKPLILLCKFYSVLFKITSDENEYYISMIECKNNLYECQHYDDVNAMMVKKIITERHSNGISNVNMEPNETTNFSIWFNALKKTSLFNSRTNREILKPNIYARSFFDFIANNCSGFEITPVCDDKGDSSLQYEYYCNRRKGINEIIPKYIKPNVRFDNNYDAKKLLLYLFGLKYDTEFRYEKYLKNPDEAFGVYNPFLCIPYLALRNVWMQNSFLADSLYEIIGKMH